MKDILIPNNYISLEKELLILIVKYLNEIRIDNKDFEELDVLGKQVTVPDDYILQIFKSFRRYLELDVGPNLKPIKSILRAPTTIFHTVHNDGSTSTAAERRFSNSSFFIKSLHNRPISIPHYMSKQSFNQVKTLCGREIKGSWNFESFKMEGNAEILPVECYETNFDRYTCILGHLSSVYCVAFDRTGHYIITGADDHLIKIWGAWDGRLLKTLRGHSAEITDLAIDAENLLLAASSVNKIIRVWSLTRNFCPVAILTGHSAMITTLQFSPFCLTDKRYLVSSGNDGNICVWVFHVIENKFDQTPVKFIERSRPSNQMLCTSFSPGGLFLAAGGSDHVTRIYFFGGNDRPEKMDELEIHTDRVDSIKFANHSLRFITGSRDGLACIWSFDSYTRKWTSLTVNMSTKLHNINGCGNTNTTNYNSNTKEQEKSNAKLRVTMVAWNSDDTVVITAMTNFRMKVWDSMNGQLLHELKGHTDDIFVLEYHPRNPRFMVSASHDGFLILWDLKFGISVTKIFNNIENQGHGAIFDAKFAPHGLLLASTDSHGQLSIYGYGRNNAYEQCPREQFFHTDFRPLIRNLETYEVTDEQTHIAPHLMPPPFLVDIDGNPYPPHVQRRVPGRHDCLDEQLIPNVAPRENGELEIMDFIENRETPPDNTPPNELNNVILPTGEQQQQPTGEEEGIRITSINNIPRHLSTLTNNVGNEDISLPQNTEEEKDNVKNAAVHSNIIRGNRTYHNVDQPIIDFYVKRKREAASYELELYKGLYNVLPVNHHERLRSARLQYYYGGAPTRKGTTIFNTSSSFSTNQFNDKKSFCNNVANNKTHISLLYHRRRGRQPKNASATAINNGMEESQTIINSGNGGHLNFIEESDVNEISGYRFADESSLENKLNNDDDLIRRSNLPINNNDTTGNNRKNQLSISSNASNLMSRTRQTQPQNLSTTFNNTTLPLLQNNNVSDAEESSAESTIYSDWEMEHGGGLGTAAAIYSSTSSIHNVNGTHSSTTKTTGSSASASSFSCHLRNKNRNRRNYVVESQSVGNTNAKRKGGGFRRQPFLGPATTSASAITADTPAKYYRRNNKRRRLLIPNTVSTAVRTSSKRKLNGNGSNSPQTSDFNPWRPSSSSTTTTTTTISSTSMLPLYNKRRRHVGRPSKLLHGGSNKCHRPVSNQFKTKVFPINRSVQNYDGSAARPFTRGMASINAAAASVKQEVLQTDDEETEIHSTKIKLKKRDGVLVDKEESLIVLSTNKQKGYFYRRHDNLSEDEDKSLDVETTGEVNRGKESIVDEDKDILDGSHSEHVKSEERAPRLRRLYGPMAPPPIKTSSTSSSAASSSYYELRRRKLKGYGNHHHHLHRLNRQRYPNRPNHLRYRRNRIVESSSKRPLTTNLLTGTRRATKRNLNGVDSNYSHYSNISHSYNTRRQIAKTEHNGEEEYVDGGGGVNKKEEQPSAFKEKADDSSSLFVVPDWMTECDPKKTPFFPQIGDEIVYFREGHELYVDMVRTSGTYPLEMKTLPYVRQPSLRAVEFARVTGLRFEIRPPRLCCVKLALTDPSGCLTGGTFSFKYHDVPHVVDFCILKQTYEENLKRAPRSFHEGSRIKAYIDDIWWKGTIVSNNYLYYVSSVNGDDVNVTHNNNNNNASTSAYEDTVSDPLPPTSSNTESSTLYYDIFLKYVVIWDKTGDLDKLSPWDMELIDEGEEEEEEDDTGDAEDVSQQKEIPTTSKKGHEKSSAEHTNGNALLYVPKPEEWSFQGRDQDIERIANGLSTVMSLADAEPFIAPVDFKEYYDYLHTIPYPIDLSLVKQRLQNGYYRRRNSLLYDLRLLLTNAKLYNDQKSQIVHQATLILELCSDVVFNERSRPLALYKTLISHNYKDKFNHSNSLSDEADQQQHAVSATTTTNHQFATRTHLNVIPETTSQNLPNQINFSATSSKPNNSSTAANYELRDVIAKLRHGPGATHQHHHQHTINNAGGTGGELTISNNNWLEMCRKILDELLCHEDSEPFRSPVDTNAYPNYRIVIKEPIDLGTIQKNLSRGFYRSYKQFRQDIRLMFANSKAFNTNKRSIIYSMTLRLSALFEARIKAFLNAMSSSGTRGGPVRVEDTTIDVSPFFSGSAPLNNNRSFEPNYRRVDNSTISQNAGPPRFPGVVENEIQILSQQQQLDESSLSLQQSATTTAEVGVRAFNETYRGRFKNLRFRAAENRRRNERRLRLDEEDVDNEITNLNNIPISNDNHFINQEQSEESTNYIGRPKRKTVIARNPCKRTLERAVKFSSSSTEISSSDNAIRTTRSIEHLGGHGSSNKIIINKNLIYPTTSNSNSNESAEDDLIEQETSLLTSTSKRNNENLNEDTAMQSSCQLNDSSSEEKSLKIIVEDLNLKGPNDLSTGQRFTRSQNKPSNNINYNYNHYYYDEDDDDDEDVDEADPRNCINAKNGGGGITKSYQPQEQLLLQQQQQTSTKHQQNHHIYQTRSASGNLPNKRGAVEATSTDNYYYYLQEQQQQQYINENDEITESGEPLNEDKDSSSKAFSSSSDSKKSAARSSNELEETDESSLLIKTAGSKTMPFKKTRHNDNNNNDNNNNETDNNNNNSQLGCRRSLRRNPKIKYDSDYEYELC